MKISITGINFNYENGYNSDYTSVNLNFNSTNATFNLNGYIKVSKDEYIAVAGDLDAITNLIITQVKDSLPTIA